VTGLTRLGLRVTAWIAAAVIVGALLIMWAVAGFGGVG
jgi:hypothetical protein